MAGTNRRTVIIGAAALGLTGVWPVDAAEDAALLILRADLAKLRWRCQRLGRLAQRAGGDKASWARWSAAVDEKTVFLERIACTSSDGPIGLMIKVQAVIWELLDDDLIMDEAVRNRLAAVSRDLERLAPKSPRSE